MERPLPATIGLLVLGLIATGCGSSAATPGAPEPTPAAGHGEVAGAAEMPEPQLHLVGIDGTGAVAMHDLIGGTDTELDGIRPPERVSSDGRYVFAAHPTGVQIIDSGVWTWDHADHFHYYRAEPRTVGSLDGGGVATVSTGLLTDSGSTGVFFPESGEAVLLDNRAMSQGQLVESLRLQTEPHNGLIVALGDSALMTSSSGGGQADTLAVVGTDDADAIPCPAAAGTITTPAAVVVGCADGAVLATEQDGAVELEHLPYPDRGGPAATGFDARKGRTTVAGLGSGDGVWLLDTRERSWAWLATDQPPVAAAAVDDADGHVVTITGTGTVEVHSGDGLIGATDPILADSLADPELAPGVSLTVDAERAYVNAAGDRQVHEIDYSDAARLARSIELPLAPVHLVETGR